ncbi:helix-turn-helix domain-containing protein [Flavobacterium flabelliforme]|uniref:helix-turn-helix domain-containing protein n=1 Tax=Flavobacterium flabelliforme TaxID=2816119 RepID=UPI001F382E41|nr:helix-turn-helix domain-containing protein [Flavobacterium flabelliforme]
MGKEEEEKRHEEMIIILKKVLLPLYSKLDEIEVKLVSSNNNKFPQYYRNEDLKKVFGFSSNTIVKYRQTGILPYTKMGDIFLYEASKIEKLLNKNGH